MQPSVIASTPRRSPSSTLRSATTRSSRRRQAQSGEATPSCSASPTRSTRPSCPTTATRSSTVRTRGCSTRDAWSAASPYRTSGGSSSTVSRYVGRPVASRSTKPSAGERPRRSLRAPRPVSRCRFPWRHRLAPHSTSLATGATRSRLPPLTKTAEASKPTEPAKSAVDSHAEPTPRSTGTNDLLAFLTFVEHHTPGSSVNAIVENYSSHGAYVRIGDVKGYVPLSLMADPAPRSAREFMKVGESITLVVESFAPSRRSIDLAIPTMATIKTPPAEPDVDVKPKRAARKSASKAATAIEPSEAVAAETATPAAPKKRAPKKAAAAPAAGAAPKSPAKKAAAATAGQPAKRAPAKLWPPLRRRPPPRHPPPNRLDDEPSPPNGQGNVVGRDTGSLRSLLCGSPPGTSTL